MLVWSLAIWLCSAVLMCCAIVSVDVVHSLRLPAMLEVLPLLRLSLLMLVTSLAIWLCSAVLMCSAVVSVGVTHSLRLAAVLKALPLLSLCRRSTAWLRHTFLIVNPTTLLLWALWQRL